MPCESQTRCRARLRRLGTGNAPEKVPNEYSGDPKHCVGDAIYDFSEDPPQKQPGVHTVADRDDDLSGEYALLSKHLFCFGSPPRALPKHLHSTVVLQ